MKDKYINNYTPIKKLVMERRTSILWATEGLPPTQDKTQQLLTLRTLTQYGQIPSMIYCSTASPQSWNETFQGRYKRQLPLQILDTGLYGNADHRCHIPVPVLTAENHSTASSRVGRLHLDIAQMELTHRLLMIWLLTLRPLIFRHIIRTYWRHF